MTEIEWVKKEIKVIQSKLEFLNKKLQSKLGFLKELEKIHNNH